jgi:DNA-binding winged helix-turn-helix (wHTH) protein
MAIILAFGPFRLDAEAEILFKGAEPIPLGRRAVALLRALVVRQGAPLSKDELINAAWPGLAVEESNLSVQIAALRRVLGEEPGGNGWIETLPRRGYRFVGPVVNENNTSAPTPRVEGVQAPALRRWDGGGHHYRPIAHALVIRDRSQFELHVQRQSR